MEHQVLVELLAKTARVVHQERVDFLVLAERPVQVVKTDKAEHQVRADFPVRQEQADRVVRVEHPALVELQERVDFQEPVVRVDNKD